MGNGEKPFDFPVSDALIKTSLNPEPHEAQYQSKTELETHAICLP